jgi:hypothetical protein
MPDKPDHSPTVLPHRLALVSLLATGCACGAEPELDGGVDSAVAWVDARPTYRDSSAYAPRDAGAPAPEPCRGTTRRIGFDDLRFESVVRMAGHGDRLAAHTRTVGPRTSRLHILDVPAGREIAVTEPVPWDTADERVVAHSGGFDLASWDETVAEVVHFDRDGALLGMDRYERTAEPGHTVSNVVRTDAAYIALLRGMSGLSLDILGHDGSVRNLPLGLSGEVEAGAAAISARAGWVVGAVAFGAGRGASRLVRFDADLGTGAVSVVGMGSGPSGSVGRDPVAVHAGDTSAFAAFALAAEVGQPSGLRLVWWSPGGAEIARRDVERLSLESIGLVGIAGRMPDQTIAYYTGQRLSLSGRGYLLAARVRAPDVVEGGEAPLASSVRVTPATTWEWTEGGIAIAYTGNSRLEVLLACEDGP